MIAIDLPVDEIRAENRQESELFKEVSNIVRQHAAEIQADPMKAIRLDHKHLIAQYKLAMEEGNKATAQATKLSNHAHACYEEARLTCDQLEYLERNYKGLVR